MGTGNGNRSATFQLSCREGGGEGCIGLQPTQEIGNKIGAFVVKKKLRGDIYYLGSLTYEKGRKERVRGAVRG